MIDTTFKYISNRSRIHWFSAISCMAKTSYFQWNDDDVRFVLDQHAELDYHSPSSLKQHVQSVGRHVAPLGRIILIPCQPVCSCSLMLRAYRRSNTYQFYNLWFDPTVSRTHTIHYATDAVPCVEMRLLFQV